jgi:ketopantoate hydroxymethyltransferase
MHCAAAVRPSGGGLLPSVEDYAAAYRAGTTKPSQVARQFLDAAKEFTRLGAFAHVTDASELLRQVRRQLFRVWIGVGSGFRV